MVRWSRVSERSIREMKFHQRDRKEDEVDDIYKELKEKHGGKYDTPRLRLWARSVSSKIHDDLDSPPARGNYSISSQWLVFQGHILHQYNYCSTMSTRTAKTSSSSQTTTTNPDL